MLQQNNQKKKSKQMEKTEQKAYKFKIYLKNRILTHYLKESY